MTTDRGETAVFEMTDEEKNVGRRPHLRLFSSMSFSKLLDESSFIQEKSFSETFKITNIN